jgi:hypothetical protein
VGVRPRLVRNPEGRLWQVRVRRYRLPPKPEYVDDSALGVVIGLARLARPALEATVGGRPWIEARSEDPPVTMVWRATGRRSAQAALEEIADALERGESRPQPFWAHWTGYDRGGIRLGRKSG